MDVLRAVNGSLMVKRVSPGLEQTEICPSCFSTIMLWLILSPRPVPVPVGLELEAVDMDDVYRKEGDAEYYVAKD